MISEISKFTIDLIEQEIDNLKDAENNYGGLTIFRVKKLKQLKKDLSEIQRINGGGKK
jgi:hypothetical protein